MTELHRALSAFWSQFTHDGKPIPAYFAGMVPQGAQFPYITFEVSGGDAFSQGINTAFVWHKRTDGKSPLAMCAESLDAVSAAIPKAGKRIDAGSGMVILYPNGADWLSYMQDQEDPDVWGGRVSYQINYYL